MTGVSGMSAREPDVVLVSMPWTTLAEPSLGLGILKSVLERQNISAHVWHLNIEALRFLQANSYYAIANVFALNDFLFSGVIEPEVTTLQIRRLREATRSLLYTGAMDKDAWGGEDGVIEQFLRLRAETIPAWLEEAADIIVSGPATLVGFTCMFDQTIASAALARLLKQKAPDLMIALGGYAVRSPTADMLLDAFPWIDAICVGEGEPCIGDLALVSAGQGTLAEVENLVIRDPFGKAIATPPAPLIRMDSSPDPNYDDFYEDVRRLSNDHLIDIDVQRLPLESSRGCWWGAVSHCTFCGIADADMGFRAKSPDVVIASLAAVSERYGCNAFRFSDYILPHTYYRTLLPRLQAGSPRYTLTGEIKANVKPEWMELLKGAGFTEVQPGIESFSDRVLKGMAKGVGAIQNIHTLLLGKATGMVVHYNIIYAFPDDDPDDYLSMVEKLPRLFHLQPPSTRIPVQITRYAPLHETPERFGLPKATYATAYDMIFSEQFCVDNRFDLDAFCYYFDRPFENSPRLEAAYRRLVEALDHWKTLHIDGRPTLEFRANGDGLEIIDTRGPEPLTYRLDEDATTVLTAMRRPVTRDSLELAVGAGMTAERLSDAIADLDRRGLFYAEGSQMICLALPASDGQAGVVEQAERELSGALS